MTEMESKTQETKNCLEEAKENMAKKDFANAYALYHKSLDMRHNLWKNYGVNMDRIDYTSFIQKMGFCLTHLEKEEALEDFHTMDFEEMLKKHDVEEQKYFLAYSYNLMAKDYVNKQKYKKALYFYIEAKYLLIRLPKRKRDLAKTNYNPGLLYCFSKKA